MEMEVIKMIDWMQRGDSCVFATLLPGRRFTLISVSSDGSACAASWEMGICGRLCFEAGRGGVQPSLRVMCV